jgi:endonuclease G
LYSQEFSEIAYSNRHHQAIYVKYKAVHSALNKSIKRTNNFKVDYAVDSTINLKSYKGSGYDRGHLKPAALSKTSKDEMKESFLMSNISPQKDRFNRVVWKKYEGYERKLLKKYGNSIIYTGTILSKGFPKKLKGSKISIPKAYFKSILLPDSSSVNFIVYHALKNGEVKEKFTTINQIEKQLGIDLFQGLPDSLETKLVTKKELFKLLE